VLDPVRAQGPQDDKVDYTGSWLVPADEISPIWGRSYRDISLEGYVHQPLARRNAKFEFTVYPASLWLEAHKLVARPRRRISRKRSRRSPD